MTSVSDIRDAFHSRLENPSGPPWGEVSAVYAVGEAAGYLAGAGTVGEVAFLVTVSKHHVSHHAVAVGNYYRNYAGASFGQHYRCAALVGQMYHDSDIMAVIQVYALRH